MRESQADRTSSPLRILISGYYGFNNLGDEAILTSMQQALRMEHDRLALTVLSANPKLTEGSHDVRAISRTDYRAIWHALGQNDLLISGGGSLLQDVTSSRSLQYYLLILAMSIVRRTPFMIYSQGIGPIRKTWNRRLTGWILRWAHVLTVRDQQSLDELLRLGVPKTKVHLSADPVLLFESPETEIGQQILKDLGVQEGSAPLIAVSVRPWGSDEKWIDQLALALDTMITTQQAQIVFIPMQQSGDEAVGHKIREHMKLKEQAFCLPHGHSVEEVLSVIKSCQLLIGVRLHALVFAAITATKAIAIRYDPKVDHFANRVGQVLAGNLIELQAQELVNLINECLISPSEKEDSLHRLAELRRQVRVSAKLAIQTAEESKR
jgi:polysaccharide pyruvyl transferase CsaB